MYIGKVEGQIQGLNVNAINRSTARNLGTEQGQNQKAVRMDRVDISPRGKKQSLIEQLMKQKDLIQENKQAAIDRSVEQGSGNIQQQLDEYDQQLKDIDEQITQLQAEQVEEDGKAEEDGESSIYENPKTKEELQMEQLSDLTKLSAVSDQAEVMSSVQNKVDGRVSVLKAEVKTGWGNIEGKLEEISALESRSRQLTPEIAGDLQEINSQITATNKAQTEVLPEEKNNSSMAETNVDGSKENLQSDNNSDTGSLSSIEKEQMIL